jgi:molecular chaperone GrpE
MADKKKNSDKEHKCEDAEETIETVSDKVNSKETEQQTATSGEVLPESETQQNGSQNGMHEEEPDQIGKLTEEVKSWNDRYLRLMAEFDNYKKRSVRDYQTMVDSANERLMTDLVDVRENFERAIKNGEQAIDCKTLFDGVKLIFNKLDTVLTKYGLEVFAAPGDVFDPQVHDALMKSPHPEIPEDHVADIYERGYLLKGKVLKHARVIVSSGKPEGEAAASDLKK